MLNWLIEIEPPKMDFSMPSPKIRVERIESPESNEISTVSQFFLSSILLGTDDTFITGIPVPNKEILQQIIQEIAPHYEKVLLVYEDDKASNINLSTIKKSSKEKFLSQLSDNVGVSIFSELYKAIDSSNPRQKKKLKYFLINKEKIQPLFSNEVEEIANFFYATYLKDSSFIPLVPYGWYVNNELQYSLFIRSFISYFEKVILVVDENDNKVYGIDLWKE